MDATRLAGAGNLQARMGLKNYMRVPVFSGLRYGSRWVKQWQKRRGCEFDWYIAEPPTELVRTLSEVALPVGRALDLGCGPGTVTAYLANHFDIVMGLDIALGAVQEARRFTTQDGGKTVFVVGDGPYLPFAENSFIFVFDRGCMHNLPPHLRSLYLEEVARVLRPGGSFELFWALKVKARATPRYLLKRILSFGVRVARGQRKMSPVIFEQLLPHILEIVKLESTRGSSRSLKILWMHAVARRRAGQASKVVGPKLCAFSLSNAQLPNNADLLIGRGSPPLNSQQLSGRRLNRWLFV